MSTGDHFAPPSMHTGSDLADLKMLVEAAKIARDPHRHEAAKAHARKLKAGLKEPQAKSAQRIKNPLYSRALDASGANDGNQGKTLNGVGIPQTGHTFGGAYDYPNSGSGTP